MSEVPLEEKEILLDDWDSFNGGEEDISWGDYDPEVGGGWDSEKEINPFLIGDMYIVLLESKEKPFLCKVDRMIEEEKTVYLSDLNDKIFIFSYTDDYNFVLKTNDYEVIEIIKVKPFDISLDQYIKDQDEIEFETEIKSDLEKEYSETIQKDDVLSYLIRSYNVYDNPFMIDKIHKITENFLDLIKISKLKEKKSLFRDNLIPIFNNDIYLYPGGGEESIVDSINLSELRTDGKYSDIITNNLKYNNPYELDESVGYQTDEYTGTILRNCIQSICVGLNGEYTYDERKTRKPLRIPFFTEDTKRQTETEFREIISSDKLTINGILEQPYNKSYYSNSLELLKDFSLYQKCIYNLSWTNLQINKKKKIKNITIVDNIAFEDSISPNTEEDIFISHNLTENVSREQLIKIINNNIKSDEDIIDVLLKNEIIRDNILNHQDLKNILFKYKTRYNNLAIDSRKKLDELISKNISQKIQNYTEVVQKREYDPIQIRKTPLTNFKRVELAYNYIFSLGSEERRNELLKDFIYKFTRSADKKSEDNHYLYNKYTNKKILCKHYLYLIEINNSNDIFTTMKNIYGCSPSEGKIHCKVCSEYLCDEDYSILQGFSDDVPINTYEILKTEDTKEKIQSKLNDKEETVKIIKIFGTMIGVILEDEDIYNILISGENFMNDILADARYKLTEVTQSDIHPRVNKLLKENKELEKKEKNVEKKKKYKKKSLKIMSDFQKWIKTTNKLLLLVSLVSLFIQTSIPSFTIQKNLNFRVIEDDDSINEKGIQYLVFQLKKTVENYKNDSFFNECIELVSNKDLESIENQLKNTIHYCNSSNFPIILERKRKYKQMIESEKREYLKEEWTTFKPLTNNILNQDINKYLKKNHDDKYLRKYYGGPFIENISMIQSLDSINNERIEQKLNIPSLEILQNSSFKRIFRYVVSCYGIHKENPLITLFLQNFLDTIQKRDKIISIFQNYGWREDTQSFSKLSFKDLREKIIPEIFKLYSKESTELRTCFTSPESCNNYIHNSVNNYDLPQLNTYPKRIYNYKIPKSFPSFEECDKEIINKLFNKFRFNTVGEIIRDIDSIDYLQKYLLDVHLLDEKIEIIREGKTIPKTSENFQKIIEFKQNSNKLNYFPTIPILNNYTEEDYTLFKRISETDSRLLKYLQLWNSEDIDTEEIKQLIQKLPQSLSQSSDPPLDFKLLNRVHYGVLKEYIKDQQEKNSVQLELRKKTFESIYSEYMKTYKENIIKLSLFLSQSEKITKDQKKRFEKIFSSETTKKIKFNSETIQKILNTFLSSSFNYDDLILYIQDIQNIITQLTRNPENLMNGTILPNNIPKEWKLTPSIQDSFQRFYERDDTDGVKHKSYLLLHNRIFTQPLNDSYPGFNNYKNISQNYHIHLESLYQYLSKYFNNLDWLKGNSRSLFNDKYSILYLRFHFIEILTKIYEYIESLKMNQLDVINDAMPLYRLLDERNEDLLEESISICSLFLMDLITHLLLQHYDATWLFLNKENLDLKNRLSKQRESEKQNIVEKYHNVSPEERMLLKNQQENGLTNQFKEASENYSKYVNSEEYALSTEIQRSEKIQEIFGQNLDFVDTEDIDILQVPNIIPDQELEEEEGYYNELEFDDNNEEFLIGMDQEQDMNFNE